MSVIDSRVINIDELKLEHFSKGDKFQCDAVRIGPLLGAKDLGYSYDVVPPGKRSCPFHSHRGEEEIHTAVRTLAFFFSPSACTPAVIITRPPVIVVRNTSFSSQIFVALMTACSDQRL